MSRAPSAVLDHSRALWLASAVAALGALLLALALALDPRRALAGYLAAYAGVLTVALGALFLLLLGELLRASWLTAWRPALDALAGTLPLLALLFVPIALGVAVLYPWTEPSATLEPVLAERVRPARAYLSVPFWLVRATLYFAIWLALAWLLRRGAGEQRRALGALGLVALALTGTFAAYDWLKSLAPYWASGIYGLRVLVGGVTGALAALAVRAYLDRRERQPAVATAPAPHAALGALLLTAVLAWGYTVVPPWIIVWSANLPVEVSWYVPRTRTSWGVVGLLLVLGHLVAPALLLLVRELRTRVAPLGLLGAWLLAMHLLDAYWLVLPTVNPTGAMPHVGDLAGLLLASGAAVAWLAWWSGRAHTRGPRG